VSNNLVGYKIFIGRTAEKTIKSLDKSNQIYILSKIKELIKDKHSLDIKKLKGFDKFYRIRSGNYRIVYEVQHKIITIQILFIGHRKEIYKELKNYL
jgi:mRNA interferase RelE/StbE